MLCPRLWFLLGLVSIGLSSCGEPNSSSLEPKLSVLQEKIFTLSCNFSSCHGGGAGGLDLKNDPYKALVGVDSLREAGKKRVVAGKPDESLLLQILKGAVGSTRPMPLNGDPLSEAKLKAITSWIENGAKND